jgi:hypothetical protein
LAGAERRVEGVGLPWKRAHEVARPAQNLWAKWLGIPPTLQEATPANDRLLFVSSDVHRTGKNRKRRESLHSREFEVSQIREADLGLDDSERSHERFARASDVYEI